MLDLEEGVDAFVERVALPTPALNQITTGAHRRRRGRLAVTGGVGATFLLLIGLAAAALTSPEPEVVVAGAPEGELFLAEDLLENFPQSEIEEYEGLLYGLAGETDLAAVYTSIGSDSFCTITLRSNGDQGISCGHDRETYEFNRVEMRQTSPGGPIEIVMVVPDGTVAAYLGDHELTIVGSVIAEVVEGTTSPVLTLETEQGSTSTDYGGRIFGNTIPASPALRIEELLEDLPFSVRKESEDVIYELAAETELGAVYVGSDLEQHCVVVLYASGQKSADCSAMVASGDIRPLSLTLGEVGSGGPIEVVAVVPEDTIAAFLGDFELTIVGLVIAELADTTSTVFTLETERGTFSTEDESPALLSFEGSGEWKAEDLLTSYPDHALEDYKDVVFGLVRSTEFIDVYFGFGENDRVCLIADYSSGYSGSSCASIFELVNNGLVMVTRNRQGDPVTVIAVVGDSTTAAYLGDYELTIENAVIAELVDTDSMVLTLETEQGSTSTDYDLWK